MDCSRRDLPVGAVEKATGLVLVPDLGSKVDTCPGTEPDGQNRFLGKRTHPTVILTREPSSVGEGNNAIERSVRIGERRHKPPVF